MNSMRIIIAQFRLCNNQISAHTLIGQSAMAYCASKLMEKSCVFWITKAIITIITKAIDHKFLWFRGMINHLGYWKNTQRFCHSHTACDLPKLILLSCSTNILHGLSAYTVNHRHFGSTVLLKLYTLQNEQHPPYQIL